MYDKKYFDYLPADGTPDDAATLEVRSLEVSEPLDEMEFVPAVAAEPRLFKNYEEEVNEQDIEAVVHRRKRDLSSQWRQTGKMRIYCLDYHQFIGLASKNAWHASAYSPSRYTNYTHIRFPMFPAGLPA